MRIRRLVIAIAALLVTPAATTHAKTLYVDAATGNDSRTYAQNSQTAPWATIGRAAWGSTNREARNGAQAAQAGDIVLVNSGTYATEGTNTRFEIAYYTENSGTSGNPIVFRAVGPVTLTLTSGTGPLIGSYNRSYITWDGFTIHEASAPSHPDTGPVTVVGCTGCIVENLNINGNGTANNRMDNHNGIRFEGAFHSIARNNRIQNVYTAHNVNNGAGVMIYNSGALTLEHNEISHCGSGIFIKGGPTTSIDYFTLRYNLIHNIGENRSGAPDGSAIIMHAGAANPPDRPTRVYQNIVRDNLNAAIKIWRFSDTDPANTPMNAKIINNTIINTPTGLWVDNEILPNGGHVFWNNIVFNSAPAIAYNGTPNNKTRFDSEHNVFWSSSTIAATASGNFSLASWQSTYGQDSAAPASAVVTPSFVNAASQDYHLQSGSAARTMGRDFLDLNANGSTTDIIPAGAYVSGSEIIGRTSGSGPGDQTPPAAPASFRLNP